MKQIDFMMLSNNIEGVNVSQGTFGIVTASLLNGVITITHNYKKKDKIVINFDDSKYLITSRSELEQVYSKYLEHYGSNDVVNIIKKYCSVNLTKIA